MQGKQAEAGREGVGRRDACGPSRFRFRADQLMWAKVELEARAARSPRRRQRGMRRWEFGTPRARAARVPSAWATSPGPKPKPRKPRILASASVTSVGAPFRGNRGRGRQRGGVPPEGGQKAPEGGDFAGTRMVFELKAPRWPRLLCCALLALKV